MAWGHKLVECYQVGGQCYRIGLRPLLAGWRPLLEGLVLLACIQHLLVYFLAIHNNAVASPDADGSSSMFLLIAPPQKMHTFLATRTNKSFQKRVELQKNLFELKALSLIQLLQEASLI